MDNRLSQCIRDLSDKDSDIRVKAIIAMGELAKAANEVMPHLIRLGKDENSRIRMNAIWALGRLGKDPNSISVFIAALTDEDTGVRTNAAWALGDMKELAETALLRLEEAKNDKNVDVRTAAQRSIQKIHENMQKR